MEVLPPEKQPKESRLRPLPPTPTAMTPRGATPCPPTAAPTSWVSATAAAAGIITSGEFVSDAPPPSEGAVCFSSPCCKLLLLLPGDPQTIPAAAAAPSSHVPCGPPLLRNRLRWLRSRRRYRSHPHYHCRGTPPPGQ